MKGKQIQKFADDCSCWCQHGKASTFFHYSKTPKAGHLHLAQSLENCEFDGCGWESKKHYQPLCLWENPSFSAVLVRMGC